jgi:hypothetical protein
MTEKEQFPPRFNFVSRSQRIVYRDGKGFSIVRARGGISRSLLRLRGSFRII